MSAVSCPTGRVVVVALISVLGSVASASAGGLTFVQLLARNAGLPDGFRGGVDVAVSADGFNVYAVAPNGDVLVSLDRDDFTGELTLADVAEDGVGGVDTLRDAAGVAVSPDSLNVYVAADGDDAVTVFQTAGGTLTLLEAHQDGVAGVSGLNGANDVAVSPDGAHVYVTADNDDTLVLFDRGSLGALSFVEVYEDGVGGITGLNGPRTLAISPDGKHVYVGSTSPPDAIALFRRDDDALSPDYGRLTFVEALIVPGFSNPRDLAVTSDGASVYAAGALDSNGALAAFRRETDTLSPDFGRLTLLEIERKRQNGIKGGLVGARALALGADDAHVYVAADATELMTTFRRAAATGLLTFVEEVRDEAYENAIGEAAAMSPDRAHLYLVDGPRIAVLAVDRCGDGDRGADEQCDDGNLTGGDGCSPSCRLELCGAAPAAGCRGSVEVLKSIVKLKQGDSDDGKDKLLWKWAKGEANAAADFGDPTATASYALCVYDASGASQPLLSMAAPAAGLCKKGKPCWTLASGKSPKYKYKDGVLTPDGLKQVLLKETLVDGKGTLVVKGKGVSLGLPDFPLTLPVTVQLLNTETAVCWESVHTAAIRNEPKQFQAKGD